jgi:hypothetical protein
MKALKYLAIFCWYSIYTIYPKDNLCGQSYHAKLHFGTLFYQGDLSPQPVDLSFGPGNGCLGVSVGHDVLSWISINGRFLAGQISGDDAHASDPARRARNLSFKSPIYEYGLYTDIEINKIWRSLDRYKIRLYLTAGINFIHFNPKAYYDGRWIELQPLGTEGQTMKGYSGTRYSLYSWSRPIGMIVEFNLSEKLSLGLEISPRKSFTDYLDDVSGVYPDMEKMVKAGNVLGARLSNRMGEVQGSDIVSLPGGSMRGEPKNTDWYTYFGVHFKYSYESNKSGLSEARVKELKANRFN